MDMDCFYALRTSVHIQRGWLASRFSMLRTGFAFKLLVGYSKLTRIGWVEKQTTRLCDWIGRQLLVIVYVIRGIGRARSLGT